MGRGVDELDAQERGGGVAAKGLVERRAAHTLRRRCVGRGDGAETERCCFAGGCWMSAWAGATWRRRRGFDWLRGLGGDGVSAERSSVSM